MINHPQQTGRREFLKRGTLAAVALSTSSAAAQQTGIVTPGKNTALQLPPGVEHRHDHVEIEYDGFSRYVPSRGNDHDRDYYLGKLVPGFRKAEEGPAPFIAPDLQKLPWELKNGAKEFHLIAQQVEREFLPGYKMVVWGFNGSMPGPTIEVNQGDRVRIVVHNELPEETSVHWHGFELPVQQDGAATLTQNMIKPGREFAYEFEVHEEGTFFYHTHVAMQETIGMVGWFIVHPRKVFDPPVDRDFGLIFQNFAILPNQAISDSWSMDWNWHTINGRSGPFTTPLVVKHGERVRVRIMNFAPVQHHPIHLHGHTFWVTGHEGARIPKTAWVPRNTELIGIAQSSSFEFIANNPGDWMFHCHMTHHMMNHMVKHVGPRMRQNQDVAEFLQNVDARPATEMQNPDPGLDVPGYPQGMKGMSMSKEFMQAIWSRREVKGMRANWPMSVKGLMTTLRVLPEDLYQKVMEADAEIEKGSIFAEIVNRFGTPETYEPAEKQMMGH